MFKSFLKKIAIVALELVLIAGALWYVAQKRGIESPGQIIPTLQKATSGLENNIIEKPFPQPAQAVVKTFSWQYQGVKYSLQQTLYQTIYDYYHGQSKTYTYLGALPQNWEEDYYGMFLKQNAQDQTIAQLSNSLQDLAQKHNLNADQTVDLVLAFIQSITYDDARAKEILAKDGNTEMQYPYETLYRQMGVCSDKSLLATVLLRQMGYGVAIFAYEQDNHMAIGIQCPKNYSTYGSGFCYAETTATGNKIGIIPTFDATSNKAVGAEQLMSLNQDQNARLQQLGQVTIFQKTSGREYLGIIATNKILAEIDKLTQVISTQLPVLQKEQKNIKSEQAVLEGMQKDLQNYQKSQNIDKFNALVEKYNNLLEGYQKDVKKYNSDVTLYNQAITRYNVLIKQ